MQRTLWVMVLLAGGLVACGKENESPQKAAAAKSKPAGQGAATAEQLAKEARADVSCPAKNKSAPRASGAPVDDVIGVRPGMSSDEAANVVLCSHDLLVTGGTTMMNRLMSCAAALMLLVVAGPAAAQTSIRDRDILSREHSGNLSSEERGRLDGIKASQAAEDAKHEADVTAARMRQARALRKTPPLPAERNGLLGSWRLGDDQRPKVGAVDVLTSRGGLGETLAALKSCDKFGCQVDWGGGITFAPSTYSQRKADGRVVEGAPIVYRSGRRGAKQVTVAITDYDYAMAFEIASPNVIVDDKGCALVRVSAPAANAAANTTAAPSSARTAVANSSVPPAAGAMPRSSTALQVAGAAGVVVDGAAFRCGDGSLLHVSLCQGNADDAACKLTELHLPGLQMGKLVPRSDIAARVKSCEAGGIRYGANDKPVFVR